VFGRATITLGIGPHSSFILCHIFLLTMLTTVIFTLPTGAVAKYCDEYVSLCVS